MSNYFSYIPNFDYVNRIPGDQNISSYTEVKNLFLRVKLNSKIFSEISNFNKYIIRGDERPDNVAEKVYGDSNLDWVVLLSNNIINIYDEWPMSNRTFELYMNKKYGVTKYDDIHHYETTEVKDSGNNFTVLKKGLEVPSDYSITFYDGALGREDTATNITTGITNYEYEQNLQDQKRRIFLLGESLVGQVVKEMKEIMSYKPSSQYLDKKTVRGSNINLY
tara:strand:- start:492 stop:1154 length:663 start_codon:yes stop_codon:yes gene_type:complete